MKSGAKAILPTIAVAAVAALGLSQSDNLTNTANQNIANNEISSIIVESPVENKINTVVVQNIIENNVDTTYQNIIENRSNDINDSVDTSSENKIVEQPVVNNPTNNNTSSNKTTNSSQSKSSTSSPATTTSTPTTSTPVTSTPATSTPTTSTSRTSTPATSAPTTSTPSTNPTSATYILNTNSKKFHRPTCTSVKKMKESNKRTYTGSRASIISQGYQPCKNCNP